MRRKKVQALIDAPKIGDYRAQIAVKNDGTCEWRLERYGASRWDRHDAKRPPCWNAIDFEKWRTAANPVEAEKAARKEVRRLRHSAFAGAKVGTITVAL